MTKKHWWYIDDARHRAMGEMVCTGCNQPITIGSYRARDAGDRYITQHRACSSFDPEWERRDIKTRKSLNELEEKVNAYRAFRDKWNEYALDEAIESLEQQIVNLRLLLPS